LRAVALELGLQQRVRFLGFKNYLDLPPLLQASDIFIRPSLSEGLGNSFLEAMAAGLITIGTPVGGIPDFLKDGVTGILCEPSSSHSIAEAIKRVLGLSVEQRQAMQARALERVKNGYDWDVVGQQMKVLFDKLTSV
jgi:glycosyltransferase involved in cell wall biosynthesis